MGNAGRRKTLPGCENNRDRIAAVFASSGEGLRKKKMAATQNGPCLFRFFTVWVGGESGLGKKEGRKKGNGCSFLSLEWKPTAFKAVGSCFRTFSFSFSLSPGRKGEKLVSSYPSAKPYRPSLFFALSIKGCNAMVATYKNLL